MTPRDLDTLRPVPEREDSWIIRLSVAFVVFFWLVIALCLLWLIRNPQELREFFRLFAAGLGVAS